MLGGSSCGFLIRRLTEPSMATAQAQSKRKEYYEGEENYEIYDKIY
jgi:hypothetical protein